MKSRPRPNTTAKSAGQHLRDSASDRSSSEQARTDQALANARRAVRRRLLRQQLFGSPAILGEPAWDMLVERSGEHTSELQSLMRISYAVFRLKKKKITAPPIS